MVHIPYIWFLVPARFLHPLNIKAYFIRFCVWTNQTLVVQNMLHSQDRHMYMCEELHSRCRPLACSRGSGPHFMTLFIVFLYHIF
jgi:hypothetical protein